MYPPTYLLVTAKNGPKIRLKLRHKQDPLRVLDKLLAMRKMERADISRIEWLCGEGTSVTSCRISAVVAQAVTAALRSRT